VDDELEVILKEEVVHYLRCYPGIRREGLRKTTKTSVGVALLRAEI
jgi:hypothetical protein